jgi:hypothetical protein
MDESLPDRNLSFSNAVHDAVPLHASHAALQHNVAAYALARLEQNSHPIGRSYMSRPFPPAHATVSLDMA